MNTAAQAAQVLLAIAVALALALLIAVLLPLELLGNLVAGAVRSLR